MIPERHEPLKDRLTDAASASELAAAWNGVREKRASRTRRREALRVGLAATALTVCLAFGGWWVQRGGGPAASGLVVATTALARSDGEALDHLGSGETVELSDRSRILVSDASELDVLQNEADVLALHLVRGRARFEVTPGGPRDWIVEAGGVRVEVVGTVFEVDRGDESLRVRVDRGVVVVRGTSVPDGVQRLTAGDELVVSLDAHVPPVEALPSEIETSERVPSDDAPREATAVTSAEVPRPPHAREEAVAIPSAAALLAEADALRSDGRQDEAIAVLVAVVTSHPSSPEAGIAAFTTARLLRARGREAEARQWYARALELQLPPALADEAREALAEDAPAP